MVSVFTVAAFLIQSAGCAGRKVVVPTAEPSSPPSSSNTKKVQAPAPYWNRNPDPKREKPKLFLISDLWFGHRLARTPENQAGAVDPETYRAQRLAEFTDDLNRSAKPKKLTGFDHFLNQTYEWGKYLLFGAALIGWIGAHK